MGDAILRRGGFAFGGNGAGGFLSVLAIGGDLGGRGRLDASANGGFEGFALSGAANGSGTHEGSFDEKFDLDRDGPDKRESSAGLIELYDGGEGGKRRLRGKMG